MTRWCAYARPFTAIQSPRLFETSTSEAGSVRRAGYPSSTSLDAGTTRRPDHYWLSMWTTCFSWRLQPTRPSFGAR
eukprot:9713093-Heterocapsa_arctica.AAC.2